MGMPSRTLTREAIQAAYGRIAPFPIMPVSYGLMARPTTDDTEQRLIPARPLIAHRSEVAPRAWEEAGVRGKGRSTWPGVRCGPWTPRARAAPVGRSWRRWRGARVRSGGAGRQRHRGAVQAAGGAGDRARA
jgi:hypothetical protein